jgi:hypothetical protein
MNDWGAEGLRRALPRCRIDGIMLEPRMIDRRGPSKFEGINNDLEDPL